MAWYIFIPTKTDIYIYRITTALKVATDIIISITASPMLVIMYVEIFKTDVV